MPDDPAPAPGPDALAPGAAANAPTADRVASATAAADRFLARRFRRSAVVFAIALPMVLALAVTGWLEVRWKRELPRTGVRTTGIVSSVRRGLRFRDPETVSVVFSAGPPTDRVHGTAIQAKPGRYTLQQRVTVRFDPDNPRHVLVDGQAPRSTSEIWIIVGLSVAGVVTLVSGHLARWFRARRRQLRTDDVRLVGLRAWRVEPSRKGRNRTDHVMIELADSTGPGYAVGGGWRPAEGATDLVVTGRPGDRRRLLLLDEGRVLPLGDRGDRRERGPSGRRDDGGRSGATDPRR